MHPVLDHKEYRLDIFLGQYKVARRHALLAQPHLDLALLVRPE